MPSNCFSKICFIHYGIGWRDGVNTVLRTLAKEISKKYPSIKIGFFGGEIKEKFIKNAFYRAIPELLPKKQKLTKTQIKKESVAIAQKLAEFTKGIKIAVIENPYLGDYHLPAMLGYSLYAKKYKPKETKVFFRVHDLYNNSPKYIKNLQAYFSPSEIKEIIKGEGVEAFFVPKRTRKLELIQEGIEAGKIVYLPNGIDASVFNQHLTREDKRAIYKFLRIPFSKVNSIKILLYPVRVVPRKNIEEAILLTHFIRELTKKNYILVISGKIDFNDSQGKNYYKKLIQLKKYVDFPIILAKGAFSSKRRYIGKNKIKEFGIGDLYQISEGIIMTSTEEGFGYPFLECWFAKKIVVGRRIPDVIDDFEKIGVKFWWLYPHFFINRKRKDLAQIKNNDKDFCRIKKVAKILQNKKIQKEILELNRLLLEKQVKILTNKKEQAEIIKDNFKAAKKTYDILKIADQFLELTGLK
ncbi:MAG: hypothetical protein LR000_01530 [Candidatus Pacebacteria bacterium]|nr:hypothetical protein [Candidatus Paceibacterota bacterium]